MIKVRFLMLAALLAAVLFAFNALAQQSVEDPTTLANFLLGAIGSKWWVGVVWCVILITIYVLKLPVCGALWKRIPVQAQVIIVAALGVLAGVGQAIIAKQPWLPALMSNLFAALATTGFDQLQSNLRSGKPPSRPTPIAVPKVPSIPPAPVLMLCIAVSVVASPGCSWFRGACATAMPVIAQGQTYAHEASLKVQQAQEFLHSLKLSEEVLKQVDVVINKALDSLALVDDSLNAASDSCSRPDVVTLFADFVRIWMDIERLMVKNGGVQMATDRDHLMFYLPVQAPSIVRLYRARALVVP